MEQIQEKEIESSTDSLGPIKQFVARYPKRIVLAKFKGRWIHPVEHYVSDNHRIDHKLVLLVDSEEKPSDFYLLDSNESCRDGRFYCAKEGNKLSINRFNPKFQLEKIKELVEKEGYRDIYAGSKTIKISDLEKEFGFRERGNDEFGVFDNGIMRMEANGEGGTGYLPERKESAFLQEREKRIVGCDYQKAREFIWGLRTTYS
jgi:hypothetical protein